MNTFLSHFLCLNSRLSKYLQNDSLYIPFSSVSELFSSIGNLQHTLLVTSVVTHIGERSHQQHVIFDLVR